MSNDPFSDLQSDPRDHVPRPKSAGQWTQSLLGFLLMALGGFVVLLGILFRVPPVVAAAIGLGIASAGFTLYQAGNRRRRRSLEEDDAR